MNINNHFDLFEKNSVEVLFFENEFNNSKNKDLDIICKSEDRSKIINILRNNYYKRLNIRPYYNENNYLYGAKQYDTFSNNILTYDICYELSFESLDQAQIIPIDTEIQNNIWLNIRKYNDSNYISIPSNEILLIYFLCKSIFTKKSVSESYVKKINKLYNNSNNITLIKYLELIFFKFTNKLIIKLDKGNINDLYSSYIKFKEY